MNNIKNQTNHAQTPAREALKLLSQKFSAAVSGGFTIPHFEGCRTINEHIQRLYELKTGSKAWNTFHGWKELGYKVKKGEHGFPIWSKPHTRDDKKTADNDGNDAPKGKGKPKKNFWVAYIFNANQVEEVGAHHDDSEPTAHPERLLLTAEKILVDAAAEIVQEDTNMPAEDFEILPESALETLPRRKPTPQNATPTPFEELRAQLKRTSEPVRQGLLAIF